MENSYTITRPDSWSDETWYNFTYELEKFVEHAMEGAYQTGD